MISTSIQPVSASAHLDDRDRGGRTSVIQGGCGLVIGRPRRLGALQVSSRELLRVSPSRAVEPISPWSDGGETAVSGRCVPIICELYLKREPIRT